MRRVRWREVVVLGLLALVLWPGAASAAAPLGLTDCGPAEGVYQCSGLVRTWDGVPLDTTVTLPSAGARRLALVVNVHGFGNSKYEYLYPGDRAYTDNAFNWAQAGYAVLTYTARGLWGSCGTPDSRLANAADCARGYIHLADVRYEVRDTQTLIGRLVDEGIAHPKRIGVTGDSYGGGQSFMLAALADRVMLPSGRLIRWRSPGGTRLRIAAAAPVIPWTDLVYAAAPNGKTLTYAITPPTASISPVGVEKLTFVNAIAAAAQFATGPGQPVGEPFVPGRPMGFLAPSGTDPEADVLGWVTRTSAGEPYSDANARAITTTLRRYHSAYYIKASHRPPPLLIGSGFTDDLFPVDEAIRFLNRTARRYPRLPTSLLVGDYGHQRASQKQRERDALIAKIHRWFDYYLRGRGRPPQRGVTAFVDTCPRSIPSLGPFHAPSFAALARGEIRLRSKQPRTITSGGGDPSVGAALDPVGGMGNACATVPTGPEPGAAAYELPPAGRRGKTLVGAPTIIANLEVSSTVADAAQVAGRLWDVPADGGTQTLVARGFYRPHDGRNVWQLHPVAWKFKPGHMAKLQLLGSDQPFGRASNGSFTVTVRRLQLRLPVRERPDCRSVLPISRPILPRGQRLAPGAWHRVRNRCSS